MVLCEVFSILTLLLSHRHSVTNQTNYVVLVALRVKKGNWKPYQQLRDGLQLIQRPQGRVTGHPGESLPESVQVIEENKR